MIRAEEVGQHPGVERIILRSTLPKPIPGPVQRLGIHGIDHDAMVEQKIDHPALGPLDRRPQLDPLSAPLVQLAAPLARPSAVCGTVRMATFVPRSSTTQTACV